jgi:hypothetical protein
MRGKESKGRHDDDVHIHVQLPTSLLHDRICNSDATSLKQM